MTSNSPNVPLHQLPSQCGTDELNLAEFPLTHLGSPTDRKLTTLEFHDQVFDERSQQPVARSLLVTGSPTFGLPGPTDADVLLSLVHLTAVRHGFRQKQVEFTRYELIRFLGWDPGGASYRRLDESLQRWTTVTLHYKQAWWDRSVQRWKNQSFHILDSLSLHGRGDHCEDRLSRLSWSDPVLHSCQSGNLKKLDLSLYFRLKRPISRQLFRFLDKRFYHRSSLEFPLRNLACEHIGLSRSHDAYGLKRKLQPALEELEQSGFLQPAGSDQRYRKLSPGHWNIVLTRQTERPQTAPEQPLIHQLTQRGITAAVARQLTTAFSASHIHEKMTWHDQLRQAGDRRLERNPAGFLKRAIEQNYQVPAGEQPSRSRSIPNSADTRRTPQTASQSCTAASNPKSASTPERASDARHQAARRYWESLTSVEQSRLEQQLLQGNSLQVEVYRRHQREPSALRDELRYALLADHLARTEHGPQTAVPTQSAHSTTPRAS